MPPTPTPPTLRHAVTLPPSAYLLHPTLHPAANLLLIPHSMSTTLSLPPSSSHIRLGSRIATLEITEYFLKSHAAPPIALLTPCLAVAQPPLTLAPIQPPILTQLTLSSLFHPLHATTAPLFARLAMSALKSRDAHPGDVIPLRSQVFALVTHVSGQGIVTGETKIVVALGKVSGVRIPSSIAAAARARWARRIFWRVRQYVTRLDACVTSGVKVVLLRGLQRDTREVVHAFAVAQHVRKVRGGERAGEVDRKIQDGGVVVCEGADGTVAEMLMKKFAGEGGFGEGEGDGEAAEEKGLVVFVCEGKDDVPEVVRGRVEVEVVVEEADEKERRRILTELAVEEDDLDELGRMSVGYARTEVVGLGDVYRDGGIAACRKAVDFFGKGKLSVDVGQVTWDDIGALDKAKEQILELVDLDGMDGALNANRRVGVLLYGPPGTGKTLLARAVAGECGCSFISVKGPELLDSYVGESEKHVREVFQRATGAAPCIVFFDELDALAPSRGRGSDSGGVADRVVSQLLAEIDDIVTRGNIFIIAASNRPDLVDPGLLRPGRLDRMVYVSMPLSRAEQAAILKAQTRKFKFAGQIDWLKVLDHAPPPPCLSGADLYGLAAEAWLNAARCVAKKSTGEEDRENGIKVLDDPIEVALRAAAEWVDRGDIYKGWFSEKGENGDKVSEATEDKPCSVQVTEEHLITAARELKPSLTVRQLREYEELRVRIETGV